MKKELKKVSLSVGVAICTFVVLQITISLILVNFFNQSEIINNFKKYAFYIAFSSSVLTVFLPFFLSYKINKKNIPQKTLSYISKISVKEFVQWFTIGFTYIFLFNILNSIFSKFLEEIGLYNSTTNYPSVKDPIDAVLAILSLAVVPAICEELAFRKYLLGSLRKYGNTFAIITSSLIFGLMHGNVFQSFFAFFTGLILGYIVVKTNNILISMLLHFCNNLIAALGLIFERYSTGNIGNYILIILIFVIIIFGILNYTKYKKKEIINKTQIKDAMRKQNFKVYKNFYIPNMILPLASLFLLAFSSLNT